jgi:hypothetical protein
MVSERLREFLRTWVNSATEPEYTAGWLRSPSGKPYQEWLPQELLAAFRAGELTPQSLAGLTGLAFDDRADIESWLREVWPMWFGRPYPG